MVKIYVLIDPITGLVRYVGKTSQELNLRLKDHISNYRLKATTHKSCWIKGLKSKGFVPIIEEIDLVLEEDWEFWERYWIAQFKTWGFDLTNGTSGGEGGLGKPNSGWKHTEEAKRRISEANSKSRPKEWVQNQCKARFKRIQQLKDGLVINEWDSATTAALTLGNVDMKKNISACAKGKKKSAYGYVWKFKI
jgi:hypothetical protein